MNINRAKTKQTGSMILEALIAILIFSIGILSLVGMQATAINAVADAKYRSTAGFLADQMVGTIRATSPMNSPSGNTISNVLATTPDFGFCTPVACVGGTVNTAAAAALAAAWAGSVASALPNATGANAPIISMVSETVTVTVNWQPPKDAQAHHHTVKLFLN